MPLGPLHFIAQIVERDLVDVRSDERGKSENGGNLAGLF